MSVKAALATVAVWVFGVHSTAGSAAEPAEEIAFRAEVVQPTAVVVEETDQVSRVELTALPGSSSLAVEIDVMLVTRIEPCGTSPEACDGSENADPGGEVVHWCVDGVDNDDDGLIDSDDPDCASVQGWTVVVATDEILRLTEATHRGTYADDVNRPPGLFTGGLRRSFLIDPGTNDGQGGAVGSLVFIDPEQLIVLPPHGDFPVLKLRGQLDLAGELRPGDRSAPIRVDIRDDGEEPLAEITTLVAVLGNSAPYHVRDLEIVVTIADVPLFKRGDTTGDGEVNISDALATLNFLFSDSEHPGCLDSADSDDNGRIEITDAVRTLEFLFSGAAAPAPPGSFECGPDPTSDELTCETRPRC